MIPALLPRLPTVLPPPEPRTRQPVLTAAPVMPPMATSAPAQPHVNTPVPWYDVEITHSDVSKVLEARARLFR